MKLRIRGNSLRLRLTKTEVARFAETGAIEDMIEFGFAPHQNLHYALKKSDSENVHATFEENRICVLLPHEKAENWTNSDQNGFEAEQIVGEDKRLRILIEKDYACLEERPFEDESDAFPHPFKGKTC
jgi:hypothetical protein